MSSESNEAEAGDLLNLLTYKRRTPEAPDKLRRLISIVRDFVGLELRLHRIIGPFHEAGKITGVTVNSAGELYFTDKHKVYRADIYGKSQREVISENVLAIFSAFDKDRDGYLRMDEFRLVLELIDPDITDQEVEEGFRKFDLDESERIDTLEFSHFVDYWKRKDPNVLRKLAKVAPEAFRNDEGEQLYRKSTKREVGGARELASTTAQQFSERSAGSGQASFEVFKENLKANGFFDKSGTSGNLYKVRLQRARALFKESQLVQQSGQAEGGPARTEVPNPSQPMSNPNDTQRAWTAEGWTQILDASTGKFYYQNHITQQTQWKPPLTQSDQPSRPVVMREQTQVFGDGRGVEMQSVKTAPAMSPATMCAPTPATMSAPAPSAYDQPPVGGPGPITNYSTPQNINFGVQPTQFPDISKTSPIYEGVVGHRQSYDASSGQRKGQPLIFRPQVEKIAGLDKAGYRDGELHKAAFNHLIDVLFEEGKNRLFLADRQNSALRVIDFGTRRVYVGGWSMSPTSFCLVEDILYCISDNHFKAFIYNRQADMFFDYRCGEELEALCFDDKNKRFYLTHIKKGKRESGARKVARLREIVSVDPSVGTWNPRRFRVEPPRFQTENLILQEGETVLEMKMHPSGVLLICTTGGIIAARVTSEYTETIYPDDDDEKEFRGKDDTYEKEAVVQPYDIVSRRWTYQCISGLVTNNLCISNTGAILIPQDNKILEFTIEGEQGPPQSPPQGGTY